MHDPDPPGMELTAMDIPGIAAAYGVQSLIGTWVETVAQALLVLRLTHSGLVLGLTTAARYARG
jgi:hypothetical protein